MTRTTNARLAGFSFLFYIATGIPALILSGRATHGEGVADKLASIAQHATDLRLAVLLTMCGAVSALVLAVTLYALTREQDPDLAMLALTCRVGEGLTGAISVYRSQGLLWLATSTGAHAPSPGAARELGPFLLWGQGGGVAALLFAIGSTLFCWLLLRGRMIPAALAWLGLIASLLLVVALPLDLVDFIPGSVVQFLWIPMAAFEVPFALWLLVRGVAPASVPASAPAGR